MNLYLKIGFPRICQLSRSAWCSVDKFPFGKIKTLAPAAFMASSGEAKELVSGEGKLNLLLIQVKVEAIWLGNYCFPCPHYTSWVDKTSSIQYRKNTENVSRKKLLSYRKVVSSMLSFAMIF